MFADDSQLFKRDEKSIEETFNVLNIYEKTPGAKINLNKIVEMYLGRWKNKTPKLKQIKWSKDPMKALGVIQGHNVNIDALQLETNKKIKSCLEVWKTCDLTYQGKVLILKTCIISQIKFEIDMRGIPERYKKEIKNVMWAFIWDGKVNPIKRDVCCLRIEEGGMGIINLD